MKLIDTHVHFDGLDDLGTPEDIIARAKERDVRFMLAVGGSERGNETAVRLAQSHAEIAGAVGWDRDHAENAPSLDALRTLLETDNMAAVGETGLDYHYHPETRDAQMRLFDAHLSLCAEIGKPAVIHSRNAEQDILELLRAHLRDHRTAPERIGVLHCFTGDRPFAGKLLDLGLYISFSGIVTFRNADALREIARYIPDDRLLIETDAPYLAPAPHRGRTNEPAFVVQVAETLAEVRDTSLEHMAEVTTKNAIRLFHLPVDAM